MRISSYRLSVYTLLLSLVIFTIGCGNEQQTEKADPEITNPVLPGDRPDPTVVKVGNTYYASATSNEWSPLFPIFKSNDLVNWELVTYVFPDGAPGWAEKNFWAPELSYDKEQQKMYAYYTARDKQTGRLSVAVASAKNPEGDYKDQGPLVSQELGSIDAYEARDKEGNLYMLWKEDGNSQGKPTPMWAQQISEDRTELMGEKTELFRNNKPWEGHLVEGISIFREGDYFYATYSAGSCCEVACDYKTGVARSKNLLGQWEKYDQNPVLTDNEDWKCLGHGSVVPKGDDFYFLYHAYSKDGSVYVGREAVLEKIKWTENNWPTFDNDVKYSRDRTAWDFSDNFKNELNPLWQWRVTQDIDYQTGEKGLMIRASRANQDLGTLLVQPTRSPNYEVSTTIDLTQTGEDADGGVALVGGADNSFGAPVAAIGISASHGGVHVWRTVNKETETLGETETRDSKKAVTLKMQVSDGHLVDFMVKDGDDWNSLADSIDASPLVPWGMGFRFGMVAKGNSTDYVNIKEFNLKNQE
jgi:beta-xylosidase